MAAASQSMPRNSGGTGPLAGGICADLALQLPETGTDAAPRLLRTSVAPTAAFDGFVLPMISNQCNRPPASHNDNVSGPSRRGLNRFPWGAGRIVSPRPPALPPNLRHRCFVKGIGGSSVQWKDIKEMEFVYKSAARRRRNSSPEPPGHSSRSSQPPTPTGFWKTMGSHLNI
jgi:hypothetical protein